MRRLECVKGFFGRSQEKRYSDNIGITRGGQQLQYISLSTLSVKAQNWLKAEFYDGPDLPTVKLIGYNMKNWL